MSGEYEFIENVMYLPSAKDIVIDIAVEMYQETKSSSDFEIICDIYNPYQYEQTWYEDYGFLFSYSREDFHQEFMTCFVKACSTYRPGPNRKLNSYFYGIMKKTMVNQIKRKAVGFRNVQVRCPICDEIVAPLGTHLLRKHLELADLPYISMGKDPSEVTECLLCPQHHKKVVFKNEEHRQRHTMSKHSSIVFSMFMAKFPGHNTGLYDPAQTFGVVFSDPDNSGETSLDDRKAISISTLGPKSDEDGETLEKLLQNGALSPCQVTMVENFLYEDAERLPSFDGVCEMCKSNRNTDECPRGESFKLTRQIFKEEMTDLGEMIIEMTDRNIE